MRQAQKFMALGTPALLAREMEKAIDGGGSEPDEITVNLTGDVTGTGSGTTEINIETTVAGG